MPNISAKKKCRYVDQRGYVSIYTPDFKLVREHVLIAERAAKISLPKGTDVHHVNEDKGDNRNCNLVVCENRCYHAMLHRRKAALDECGNANWRKCNFCKSWDSKKNLYISPDGRTVAHKKCQQEYNETRRLKMEKQKPYGDNAKMADVPATKEMIYTMANGDEMRLTFGTVRKYLVQGNADFITDSEILYYLHECKARKLNPFLRQCWLIKYSQRDSAQIVESIQHKRNKARKAEDCKGWEKGLIVQGSDGEIKRTNGLLLEDETLLGAFFRATPEKWSTPYELEINLNGYIKKKQNGDVTAFWSKEKQPSQIMKVAESQGLSALWGDTIGNTYIPEELPSIDMFQGSEGAYEQKIDTSAFDKLAGDVKKQSELETFLQATAKANEISVDVLKSQAAGKFKSFMNSFNMWLKNQKEPEKKEKAELENWWATEKHWKFLGGDRFISAIKNHAEDLDVAGKEIRNAVWAKFISKNEKDAWPLKPAESVVVEEKEDEPEKEPEKYVPSKDWPGGLGGDPGYTARNSEDFKDSGSSNSDDPEKEEQSPSPEEGELTQAKSELYELKKANMAMVEKAAENLKMSTSPMTLDGAISLIEETETLINSKKM